MLNLILFFYGVIAMTIQEEQSLNDAQFTSRVSDYVPPEIDILLAPLESRIKVNSGEAKKFRSIFHIHMAVLAGYQYGLSPEQLLMHLAIDSGKLIVDMVDDQVAEPESKIGDELKGFLKEMSERCENVIPSDLGSEIERITVRNLCNTGILFALSLKIINKLHDLDLQHWQELKQHREAKTQAKHKKQQQKTTNREGTSRAQRHGQKHKHGTQHGQKHRAKQHPPEEKHETQKQTHEHGTQQEQINDGLAQVTLINKQNGNEPETQQQENMDVQGSVINETQMSANANSDGPESDSGESEINEEDRECFRLFKEINAPSSSDEEDNDDSDDEEGFSVLVQLYEHFNNLHNGQRNSENVLMNWEATRDFAVANIITTPELASIVSAFHKQNFLDFVSSSIDVEDGQE